MKIFAGLDLGGAALVPFHDLRAGSGALGHAVFGPSGLLGDLELRLGLGIDPAPSPVRVAAWVDRMGRIQGDRFYSASYGLDPLGTARAVLGLRDELIEAGWTGEPVLGGGVRLDAVAELEALDGALLPGDADRLAAVARAVERAGARVYDELCLAEPDGLWASCWQRVFASLTRGGTHVHVAVDELPGAAPESDLGRVQSALTARSRAPAPTLTGDGSFVVLAAETSWEAAHATAAVVRTLSSERAVILREEEASTLDHALAAQGLPGQGWVSRSPWRAATQVLPLALELAFEPKDPYRVLELLMLPLGPFRGIRGQQLARALAQSPGIGSPAWEHAKRALAAFPGTGSSSDLIDEWLERPGADPVAGARKQELLAVTHRVREWVISRVAATPADPALLVAAGQATAFRRTLESDPRDAFGVVEVRRLVESVLSTGTKAVLAEEQTGRIAHAAGPGSLRVPRELVVWWAFVAGRARRSGSPWRLQERTALNRAGLVLPDPRLRLAARANDWRRAIQAATQRVVLVVPRTSAGESLSPHPLWAEISAAARIDPKMQARLTVEARDLLAEPDARRLLPAPSRAVVTSVPLPVAHAEWQLQEQERPSLDRLSASSLDTLLGCPLKWALGYRAGLRAAGHALPRAHQLNGSLGHRLVECLHQQGAFALSDDAELARRAETILEDLIRREGASLLRPGMAFERAQLQSQLVRAVRELARALRTSGLRVVAIEKQLEATLRDKTLRGRLDLLVANDAGAEAIVDMKWGFASYRDLLQAGRALQLAFYGFVHSTSANTTLPEVAYFSLSRGRLLALPSPLWRDVDTVDAPSLADTWRAVERSLSKAEEVLSAGRLPVTGVRKSLPLLEAFGVPPNEQGSHFSSAGGDACEYCELDALCGRRWEQAS